MWNYYHMKAFSSSFCIGALLLINQAIFGDYIGSNNSWVGKNKPRNYGFAFKRERKRETSTMSIG